MRDFHGKQMVSCEVSFLTVDLVFKFELSEVENLI